MRDREDILESLEEIIKDVLDSEQVAISEETCLEDIPEWDSVVQMTIVALTEQQFGVRFEIDRIANARTVGDFVDMLIEK